MVGEDRYPGQRSRLWRPPTDVYETDDRVVIKVEVAGMNVEDFTITFADRHLVISGCRKDPGGKLIYQNMEIRYGEFRTDIMVGWALDQAEIRATYDGGFLHVELPKASREVRIPVRTERSEG